ncbi:MAG TPA: M24 family metallopeptidase [Kofleriaceae bacterium]|nr:M24 family metallopeptidase [Kofleriaceae bacterium]
MSQKFSSSDVARFRFAQRVAYEAAVSVAEGLARGTTEKAAAAKLEQTLAARGVHQYFHKPFAWFGDRTRLPGRRALPTAFFPTDRALEPNMIGILDVAPVVDGYAVDIGYTFTCGEPDRAVAAAMDTLREIRALIPEHVTRGDTMRSIYRRIDRMFAERGYENRHCRYPGGVLGHRVAKLNGTGTRTVAGFGIEALTGLARGELLARLPLFASRKALWNGEASAARAVPPGLWAIEPHLGTAHFGAKFEELLVVDEGGAARWLDDTVPHA